MSLEKIVYLDIYPSELKSDYKTSITNKLSKKYLKTFIEEGKLITDIIGFKILNDGPINIDTGNVRIEISVNFKVTDLPNKGEKFNAVISKVISSGVYLSIEIFQEDINLPIEIFMLKTKEVLEKGNKFVAFIKSLDLSNNKYLAIAEKK